MNRRRAILAREGKRYLFSAAIGVQRVRKDPSLLTKAERAQRTK